MLYDSLKKDILYSMQVLLVSISSLVLAPKLIGLSISLSLLMAGIGTLIYHIVTHNKIPVFLGPSLYFVVSGSYIVSKYGISSFIGASIVCSIFYIVLAFFFPKDKKELEKYFPICIITTILLLLGLSLSNMSLKSMVSIKSDGIFDYLSFSTSIITVMIMVYFSYFIRPKFRIFAALIAICIGTLICICFGLVDFSPLIEAKWIVMPWAEASFENKYRFPSFSINTIFIMLPIYMLVVLEHASTLYALSRQKNEDYFFGEIGIKKSYLGMFFANFISSLFGVAPGTMYLEVISIVGDKEYTPAVLSISAVLLIFISLSGKIVVFLSLIPSPVISGIVFVYFMRISVFGMKYLILDSGVEYLRNLLLVVFILFINMGNIDFRYGNIAIEPLSLSLILSLTLNFILVYTKTLKITVK